METAVVRLRFLRWNRLSSLFHRQSVLRHQQQLRLAQGSVLGAKLDLLSCRKYSTDVNIVKSVSPSLDFPNLSLGELMLVKCDEYAKYEAMRDVKTGQTLTYAQLKDAVIHVGSALSKLGYKKGDVISVCAVNSIEYAILLLGVISIGGIVSPLNPASTKDDLFRYFADSGATAVVTDVTSLANVREASTQCPNVKEIIIFGESDGCRPFSSLLEDDGKAFPENVDLRPEDIAFLPYSSGTMGFPKGVVLTHRNIVANLLQFRYQCPAKVTEDRIIGYLPFFHIYGLVIVLFYSFLNGLRISVVPKFEQDFLQLLEKYQISILHLVPPVCVYMAKHPDILKFDLSHVRLGICGAAPLGKENEEEFVETTKIVNIVQGYGLTETSPVVCCDTIPARMGSVGTLLPNTSAKILDMTSGDLLGANSEGEICFRGPQVMAGYLGNPEATAATIIDNWIHTGDVGHYDEDGYFHITDRVKELIKYKGFQVAPAELEAMLLTHPAVQDAAVIGVPDQEAGEVPRAFVVLKKGQDDTSQDSIISFVNERVAYFKKIRGGLTIVHEIAKSPSGKILRRLLRQQYI